MTDSLYRKIFITSLIFLYTVVIFSIGLIIVEFKVWPYNTIKSIYKVSESLWKYGEIIPKYIYVNPPGWASRQRLTIYNQELIVNGYYAFMGWDAKEKKYSTWLYNNSGDHLHTWAWDYDSLDPDGPLNESDSPHAFKLLADGSLIVSFDTGDVMARLDSCSQPIWIKKGIYNHSLERAEDGSYWTWRGEGTAYGHYHYLENFNPDTGATIKEIDLVEDIIKNMGPAAIIFGVRPDYKFLRFEKTPIDKEKYDIFHPNDIDVLYSNLAHKFPNFSAGDLLLSFRNLHLIAVMDPDTMHIKWWSYGPWKFQHDPDFTEDGKISVYNNNTNMNRSEIIKIDPLTREISNDLFYGETRFYSHSMGKHQYLPNGNVLIVNPGEGRILEVSKKGDKVLEFNNIIQDREELNAHIENGLWLPPNYFDTIPKCSMDVQ